MVQIYQVEIWFPDKTYVFWGLPLLLTNPALPSEVGLSILRGAGASDGGDLRVICDKVKGVLIEE